jgi:hypothetical protein
MQDGALSHYSMKTGNFLDWLGYSPDLKSNIECLGLAKGCYLSKT